MSDCEELVRGEIVEEGPDYSAMSLVDLADFANREQSLAVEAAADAVDHAIRCGEALREVKSRLPDGEWNQWMKDHVLFSRSSIMVYVRLATYSSEVMATRPSTIKEALANLRELDAPPVSQKGPPMLHIPAVVLAEARDLRSRGESWRSVSESTGLSVAALRNRLDPDYKQKATSWSRRSRRRKQQAQKALEREERRQLAKTVGGEASVAYADVRKLAVNLDRALAQAPAAARESLAEALRHAHKAEDAIVSAMNEIRREQ